MDRFMERLSQALKASRLLGAVYLANILLSFHNYLLVYINSSYLAAYFTASQISALFMIGSIICVLVLVNASRILNTIGNYCLILSLIILECVAAFGLAFFPWPWVIALCFMVYIVTIPVISFGLDILLEDVTEDEGTTGEIRTTFITLGNASCIVCTLLLSVLLAGNHYWIVYLTSIAFLLPLTRLMKRQFSNFQDSPLPRLRVREAVKKYMENKDLYNVFNTHLYLQIFYGYMTIYIPLYLSQVLNFSWTQIGLMFTIMLLPFLFVEVPVGWLADKRWGEKEMMAIGLFIMGVFSIAISFITIKSFFLWTIILFMTRIGAAMTEATSDSYFFKKVDKRNANTIGLYRIGGPAGTIIASILATVSLQFMPLSWIFIPLGILMIFGCRYALLLVDTR